jgi:O-antigen/teichoic acid export membrane protein
MEKHFLKNLTINFVGLILPVFVSLVTVPAYIHTIGLERYGVLTLVWALVGYFSVLDLGISMATEKHISIAKTADVPAIPGIFWSAFFLNLATGVLGGGLVWLATYVYLYEFTNVAESFRQEVLASLPWIAFAIPVANVSWVFAGALNGMERFKEFNVNQTLGTFLFQILPLLAAIFVSPKLSVVIPAAIIARFAAGVLLGRAVLRVLGIKAVHKPDRATLKELFGYSKWLVLYAFANTLASSLDRMILGSMTGARQVAYFATPQNLVTRLNLLPVAMLRTLFPRFAANGQESAAELTMKSLSFLNFAYTPAVIFAMFALGPFMNVWVGSNMAEHSTPVGRILILGIWMAGQSGILSILIQAQSNPALNAVVGWTSLPVYAALLWAGIHWYGMEGASVVVVLKAAADYLAFLWLAKLPLRAILINSCVHFCFVLMAAAVSAWSTAWPVIVPACVGLLLIDAVWSLVDAPFLRTGMQQVLARLRTRPRTS